MAAKHLHRNRHGTFGFRVVIPDDLRPYFSHKVHRVSLRTGQKTPALWIASRLAPFVADKLRELRTMKPSDAVRRAAQLALELANARDDLHNRMKANEVAQHLNDVRLESLAKSRAKAAIAGAVGLGDTEEAQTIATRASELEEAASHLDKHELQMLRDHANTIDKLGMAADTSNRFHAVIDGITSKITKVVEAAPKSDAPLSITVVRQIQNLDADAGKLPVSKLFELYCEDHKDEWRDWQTRVDRDYTPALRKFLEMLGSDLPVEQLNGGHSARFVTYMKDWAKKEGRKLITVDGRYLGHVRAVFAWAEAKNYVLGLTRPLILGRIKADSYERFAADELKLLFESEQYRANSFNRAGAFWVPLIALYSGARIDEIASLELKHAGVLHDDLPCFEFSHGERKGKTDNAKRIIPVHPKLIECGLLEFLETMREGSHKLLFPCFPGDDRDGRGRYAGRDFLALRRSVDIGSKEGHGRGKKTAHSFRSTFISAMQEAGVTADLRKEIAGHAPTDVHGRVYSQSQSPMRSLLEAIRSASFDFVHPTWEDTAAYRWSRRNGRAYIEKKGDSRKKNLQKK